MGERNLGLAPGLVQSEQTDGLIDPAIRRSDIGWFTPEGEHRWLFDRIKECVNAVNADWFRFDLVGFEGIQFTKYSGTTGQSGFYASHIDLKSTNLGTMRKLSFTIQLSEPESYEGGDVALYDSFTESLTISRNVGSITFFPSYKLHEMRPVTRGVGAWPSVRIADLARTQTPGNRRSGR